MSVAADGRYAVNRKPVDGRSIEVLTAELAAAAAGNKDVIVIVSADATAAHQSVINVMDAARRANLPRMTFRDPEQPGWLRSVGPTGRTARFRRFDGCEWHDDRDALRGPFVSMIERAWLTRGPLAIALLPLALVYAVAVELRRAMFGFGWARVHRLDVPVVVVGNLIAGGAGKTPTVMAIAALVARCRMASGIVSRGYGRVDDGLVDVQPDSAASRCGERTAPDAPTTRPARRRRPRPGRRGSSAA